MIIIIYRFPLCNVLLLVMSVIAPFGLQSQLVTSLEFQAHSRILLKYRLAKIRQCRAVPKLVRVWNIGCCKLVWIIIFPYMQMPLEKVWIQLLSPPSSELNNGTCISKITISKTGISNFIYRDRYFILVSYIYVIFICLSIWTTVNYFCIT